MGFKKVCCKEEYMGATKTYCHYEFVPEQGEVFDALYRDIETLEIDEIPEQYTIKTKRYLNPECTEIEEREFVINPFEYLSNEEIEELENFIEIVNALV